MCELSRHNPQQCVNPGRAAGNSWLGQPGAEERALPGELGLLVMWNHGQLTSFWTSVYLAEGWGKGNYCLACLHEAVSEIR